jgi:toxin secretion/phage lysis holin
MDKFKNIATLSGGIIGSFVSFLVGAWNGAIMTLLSFMLIDYLTGFIVGAIFQNSPKSENGGLSSKVGFKGLCKKMMILLFLFVAYRLDLTLGTSYIKDGVCYAFIVNELISILENGHYMGVEPPEIISKAIDVMKSKDNK